MPTLNDTIDSLTNTVLTGEYGLDDALSALETWIDAHAAAMTSNERQQFSATLDQESSNDDRSLIQSVLKLHATRLLYRWDRRTAPPSPPPDAGQNAYMQARTAFTQALSQSEDAINEARIDIAVANAHHLLANVAANRHWLDRALDRLPDLAAIDLVQLAEAIPAMPLPRMGPFKRLGLKLMGFNFDRLAQQNVESLAGIAHMQINQIILLSHLLGTSYQAIREPQRARRAFRIAAHLIVRHGGMMAMPPDQLIEIAESIQRTESEAAGVLARQAYDDYQASQNGAGLVRARAILAG